MLYITKFLVTQSTFADRSYSEACLLGILNAAKLTLGIYNKSSFLSVVFILAH